MSGPVQRWIFVLGFLAACAAFWLGYRRVRRLGTARTAGEAFRLAFYLSLALMVGCSSGAQGAGAATTTSTTTATATTTSLGSAGTTGLGEEADAVWRDVVAVWNEAGTYVEGEVTSEQLEAARSRVDGLLSRLAGLGRVASDAPGLVALLRIEFGARLEMRPANVLCYEPAPARTSGAEAYERLAARVDAVDELATKGYVNGWLRDNVLERLRDDLRTVREAMAAGDGWRTDDWQLSRVDPAQVEALVSRIEASLARLQGP